MSVRVVRLGSPRRAGERIRIGTVHRRPRGVPKAHFSKQNWYDVWFPNLAPLSHTTHFSAGCTCEDESRGHRSILKQLLIKNGAKVE